jgi:hypothetical protein
METIVCLPKQNVLLMAADRHSITLLNSNYKIATRIIKQRLRLILETHLRPTKHCSVLSNTILDTVVTEGTPLPTLKQGYPIMRTDT